MSLAVTFVMVLATAATWPIQTYLLTPASGAWDLGYLQTIVFILIIAILVQLLENVLKKFIPRCTRRWVCICPDHHQLHHPGRDHPEHRQRL
mgnify:CR=1 FL=1